MLLPGKLFFSILGEVYQNYRKFSKFTGSSIDTYIFLNIQYQKNTPNHMYNYILII